MSRFPNQKPDTNTCRKVFPHLLWLCVPRSPQEGCLCPNQAEQESGPPWALCAVSARLSRALVAVWGACGGPPRDHLNFPTWGGHGHMEGRAVAGAFATLPAGSIHPGLLGMTPPSPGALPRGPTAVFWADVQWKTLLDSTCHREGAPCSPLCVQLLHPHQVTALLAQPGGPWHVRLALGY